MRTIENVNQGQFSSDLGLEQLKCNILFPRNEEGEVDVERGVYDTTNQPKRASFKHEQDGLFCLVVAKVESQDGKIIGKRCPVLNYTEKEIVTIDA